MSKVEVRLSVIMPVLNGAAHLEESLNCLAESLKACDETIVIDDGSVDATPEIIKSFFTKLQKLHVITNLLPTSPSSARNAGLAIANGKYISFLDHDDLWTKGRVERHLDYLERHSEFGAIVGKVNNEFEGEIAERAFAFKNGSTALHHVHLGAATFRADIFKSLGFFNESLRFSEDHEFFLRMREQGHKIYFDPDVSLRYRVHGTNMTLDKSLHELGMFRILKESIKRRQLQGNMQQLPKFGDPSDV
ncbi:MAG: glycosyltransferase [Polynucleobacter sp.]|uniref:glycosyltransferase family 2 protein n=1 Tax=Polynucleobacter sp. TaxID=2029855 RepID=UPI0021704578|nr:glycosyltransferase [Polynucleobacter sp.]MBU3670872.1 glycosyltransferase [Polynucleobacter sp.]